MAGRVSSRISQLLKERKLVRSRITDDMILKELRAARSDLLDAQDSVRRRNFKWATIQAYYSSFHSARALLYSRGFRERSHRALLITLRELFAKELPRDVIDGFQEAMELRQEADYGLTFSEEGANNALETAKNFSRNMREILRTK